MEFHLNNGVDFVIVTNNGSIDGTYETCKTYLGHGVKEIIREPVYDKSQYAYVSKMANLASLSYGADWTIHCDADEFFVSRKYKNLKTALSGVDENHTVLKVSRHDFVPIISTSIKLPLDMGKWKVGPA